ncbi:hypothetical protein QJ856_gp0582 [Tupanvirus deep ocean]|uniref:Uncharacterized protein n=2 Tax=Tupanvirus TaxID=2094720 RepID=A0AC62A8U0_9VIRU|nr:hypothetical protein QJ856_gp0582 [Tupanvirus deep ocean]QKU34164.1 hypothetical protein [Tupanvirus deep ocean]
MENSKSNDILSNTMCDKERSIHFYSKLMDLVEKYNIMLSKLFNIDSDPDELEVEYEMQMHRLNEQKAENIIDQITYLMFLFIGPYL